MGITIKFKGEALDLKNYTEIKNSSASNPNFAEAFNEWVGMPEFIQAKKEPFAKIIFRFETEEDLKEFSALIGQKLTGKTKSAWHPQLELGKTSHLKWKSV